VMDEAARHSYHGEASRMKGTPKKVGK
jgi:hypothetical protein